MDITEKLINSLSPKSRRKYLKLLKKEREKYDQMFELPSQNVRRML